MLKFLLLSLISFTYSQEASCHSLNDWLSTQAARNQEAVQFLEYLYIKIQVGDDFVHVNSNDIVQLYDHEQYATQFQLIPHFNVEESASFRSRQQTPPVVDPTLTQYSFVKTFGKGSKGALKTKYLPWYKDAYRRSAVKFEKPAAGSDFQSEIIGGRYFIIPLSDGTGFNVRSVEKPDYSWTSSVAQLRKQIILKKGDGDTVLFNLTSRTFCTNYHDLATGNLIQLDSGQSDLISSRNFMVHCF